MDLEEKNARYVLGLGGPLPNPWICKITMRNLQNAARGEQNKKIYKDLSRSS